MEDRIQIKWFLSESFFLKLVTRFFLFFATIFITKYALDTILIFQFQITFNCFLHIKKDFAYQLEKFVFHRKDATNLINLA